MISSIRRGCRPWWLVGTERDFLETLFDTIEDGVLVLDGKAHISAQPIRRTSAESATGQGRGAGVSKVPAWLDWDKLCAEESTDSLSVTRHELEVAYPIRRFLRVYTAALFGAHGLAVIINDATEQQQKTFEVSSRTG